MMLSAVKCIFSPRATLILGFALASFFASCSRNTSTLSSAELAPPLLSQSATLPMGQPSPFALNASDPSDTSIFLSISDTSLARPCTSVTNILLSSPTTSGKSAQVATTAPTSTSNSKRKNAASVVPKFSSNQRTAGLYHTMHHEEDKETSTVAFICGIALLIPAALVSIIGVFAIGLAFEGTLMPFWATLYGVSGAMLIIVGVALIILLLEKLVKR